MGHFPPKFLESLSSETTDRFEKIKGCKNSMDILYLRAKFGGDPPLHGGVRNKSWLFLFFVCLFVCLFVTLWILNRGLVIQIAILSPYVGQF